MMSLKSAWLILGIILSTGFQNVVKAQTPPRPNREKMIAVAREVMSAARYCTLITIDSTGRANARTMDPFLPEDDMVVWFATTPLSRKVREIKRRPDVTIHCFDPKSQDYFSLRGIARLVNDPEEKAQRWKDDWKQFYPDRTTHYVLIKVQPERLELVSQQKGILGDPLNWDPPSINFLPKKFSRSR